MSSVLYGILWILSRTVGRLCFHYRVVGAVPQTGGFIVAANHASYLDIPLLGCGMRRRAWFLGRSDLFPVPGLKAICQWLGWIPLRIGRLDRDAFGKAVDLIKEGKVVVIFPEGRRSLDGRLQSPKPGIGVIVAQTGCPVVPAYRRHVRRAAVWNHVAALPSCDRLLWRGPHVFPEWGGWRREAVLSGGEPHRDGSHRVTRCRGVSDPAVQCRHSQG